MYKTHKQYENGGKVLIPKNIDKKGSDYKPLINIANFFAKEDKTVILLPTVHFKSNEYKEIYNSLIVEAACRQVGFPLPLGREQNLQI